MLAVLAGTASWFGDVTTGTDVHVAISAAGRNDWVSLNGTTSPTADRTLIEELGLSEALSRIPQVIKHGAAFVTASGKERMTFPFSLGLASGPAEPGGRQGAQLTFHGPAQ